MRVPLSWLREYVDLPAGVTGREVGDKLVRAGLEVETVDEAGADIKGPIVVARVLSFEVEEHSNGKSIRWCSIDTGEDEPRWVVCGAHNFVVGDLVVAVLPGAVLPGGFEISARNTYGHVSDGMICSTRELGMGVDHTGILVLGKHEAKPGADAVELLHLRDDVLDIAVTPDRGYALSIRGVAREVATAYGVELRDPAAVEVNAKDEPSYGVRVEDPAGCPVFVARTVTGINPKAATPRWMQQRLVLAGMRPISIGVDVTNYVMLELGQPIHGYDKAKLAGDIVVRRARAGEKLVTLDDQTRDLDPEDLLITDDSGPIGIAGVMGGASTEISESTSDVVIEAAHFDAIAIARSSRRHKLSSEASRRFERGVDPELPPHAAQRVADLLSELAGGTVERTQTLVGDPIQPKRVTFRVDHPAKVAGAPISREETLRHLKDVGCKLPYEREPDDDLLTVTAPSWRPDLRDPNDFAEEVIRLYGYENVPSVLPAAPGGHGLTVAQRRRRRVAQALVGAGLTEVVSYPFVGDADLDALGLPADDVRRDTVKLTNPLSDEEPGLQTTLLPGLLRTAARNVGRGHTDLAIYQTALVFKPRPDSKPAPLPAVTKRPTDEEIAALYDALPEQPTHLAAVLTGARTPAGWWGKGEPVAWADAVQVARTVAAATGAEVTVRNAELAPWHPGRCAAILVGDEVVGHAGELHPKVCQAFGLPPRSAAAEVDLDKLIDAGPQLVASSPFSSYPVAKEDVALIVPASVAAADVEAALVEGAGELLESVRLFDVYTGEQAGEGKKSLAFALRFRAPDRTLTEAEVADARQAAVQVTVERFGAVQRVA
ncbi:MAG TPA: phenylalanine--tRNA ligase subunit beta [Kribbellaceae bacterium]